MFFIIEWAYNHEYISYSYYRLSKELLEKYGFKPLDKSFPVEKIIEIMKKDKKASDGKITFIIPCDKKAGKRNQAYSCGSKLYVLVEGQHV